MKQFDDETQLTFIVNGMNPVGYIDVYGAYNWPDVEIGMLYQGNRVLPVIVIDETTVNPSTGTLYQEVEYGRCGVYIRIRSTLPTSLVAFIEGADGLYTFESKDGLRDGGFFTKWGSRLLIDRTLHYSWTQRYKYLFAKFARKVNKLT